MQNKMKSGIYCIENIIKGDFLKTYSIYQFLPLVFIISAVIVSVRGFASLEGKSIVEPIVVSIAPTITPTPIVEATQTPAPTSTVISTPTLIPTITSKDVPTPVDRGNTMETCIMAIGGLVRVGFRG
jgi:hypothetical protein